MSKLISSRENPQLKALKALATSTQARRRAGQCILEGVHLCEAWLAQRGLPAYCVVSEAAQTHPEAAALLARCEENGVECLVLAGKLFSAVSQLEQGVEILFVIDTPANAEAGVLNESAVLLDNVQDPGNVGSILRSAAAAGVARILCGPGTAFAWSGKVLRAGMGAHFSLSISENVDLAQAIAAARVPVYATSSHAAADLYQLDLHGPAIWLFGHEGQGVRADLLAQASQRVAIPHRGPMESLNVAASAAICLFEHLRQNSSSAQPRKNA
jgi:TrmH family RNA methyltransferase